MSAADPYLDVVAALDEALAALLELTLDPRVGDAWQRPSTCEGYSIGGLVGHVLLSVGWVATAVQSPPPEGLREVSAGELFSGLAGGGRQADAETHEVLRAMGEAEGSSGVGRVSDGLASLREQLPQLLGTQDGARLLDLRPVAKRTIRLDEFARTRVVEAVVHADDLAASVGIAAPPMPRACRVTAHTLLDVALVRAEAMAVVADMARAERRSGVFPVL